jgi:type IV pilus assembly protein PilC
MPKKLQRKVAPTRPQAEIARVEPKTNGRAWLASRRVSPRLLSEFTSQLAVLLDAGIPVSKCLRVLEGQLPPGALKRTTQSVVEDVESGTSLSESFAKHPAVFDRLYTNMVRAGEAGGVQDEILNRLAIFMEKTESVKSRVRAALAYPIAVLGVAVLVMLLLFLFVIPKFKDIFAQQFRGSDNQLPALTQFVLNLGEHVKVWWWAYFAGVILLVAVHRVLLARVPAYRRWRDQRLLRAPVFGALIRKSLVARFTRTFGTLIQSGVPHLEALEIVQGSISNVRLSDAISRIHASIREGAGIAVPMGESRIFDDVVVNMVDVGEQTGELDRMLTKIADRYETEVDRSIETTIRVIEPIMLLVMAVVVAGIALALLLPLLKLMEKLR